MSWSAFHTESERLAQAGYEARRRQQQTEAAVLYRAAALAEQRAFDSLDRSKGRTRGITAVSAASLYYKAEDLPAAETLAIRLLAVGDLPAFAVGELQNLLKAIWSDVELAAAGLQFSKQDIFVSVKGGEVFTGGAPLDLIVRKLEEVRAFYYRTVEWAIGLPVRMRGAPRAEIQQLFRPWLLHAPPGSYQFAVRLQSPPQREFDFVSGSLPPVEEVMSIFIAIVRQAADDPDNGLQRLIPDPAYQNVFMKLARSLAPAGKSFSELVIRTGRDDSLTDAVFRPETRRTLNDIIKSRRQQQSTDQFMEPVELRGTLRAVHLDQDWIEVTIADPAERHIKVEQAGEAIDDVVGPLVNRRVVVQTMRNALGKFLFSDIDAEE